MEQHEQQETKEVVTLKRYEELFEILVDKQREYLKHYLAVEINKAVDADEFRVKIGLNDMQREIAYKLLIEYGYNCKIIKKNIIIYLVS